MSDEPTITYSQHEGPIPNDGVPTYGWRFEVLRRRKIRCGICNRWARVVVLSHDADVTDANLKAVCKRCYDEMP